YPALAAFDGEPSLWMPETDDMLNSIVGFDFGAGGDKAIASVRVDWANALSTASKIEFQYGDFGREWQSAGVFEVKTHRLGPLTVSEHQLPSPLGSHRLWRLMIREVSDGGVVAIREVRFIERDPS